MIPVALLLSISLLAGCGGKKDDKKPSEPESQESSEPEPEPGPGPEPTPEGLEFPKTIEDAKFIYLGELTYDVPDEHFMEIMSQELEFEDMNFSGYDYITASWEDEYYYGYYSVETDTETYQVYNDGISISNYLELEEYEYPGLCKYQYEDENYESIFIETEDGTYEKDTEIYEGMAYYNWYLYSDFNPAEYKYDNALYGLNFNAQPAYARIGDYYYVAGRSIYKGSSYEYSAYDEYFTYCYTEKSQLIIEIDLEGRLSKAYRYSEDLVDHDMVTGSPLDEPQATYRSMFYIDMHYDDYKDHPEAQNILNSVPEQYLSDARISYRTAAVTVGDDGKMTAAPEFPSSYNTGSSFYFDDYETAVKFFSPYYNSQYFAVDFDRLTIIYTILKGEDAGDSNIVNIEFKDEFLEEVAEQMNAELQVFNEETYFIVNRSTMREIEFVFSALNIEGASDVTVRRPTSDYFLR